MNSGSKEKYHLNHSRNVHRLHSNFYVQSQSDIGSWSIYQVRQLQMQTPERYSFIVEPGTYQIPNFQGNPKVLNDHSDTLPTAY